MTLRNTKLTLDRVLPVLLIIVGIIGLLAAFIITVDKIKLLEDPNFRPSCSINPIISCGSVMESEQSHLFGFANSLIGLVGFPVLIVTGVVLLGGAKLKRWYWLGLNAGLFLGICFVHWLFFQSVYRIGALCPYCMVVWVVTITGFWYTTLYNLQHGHLALPAKTLPVQRFVRRHHADILVFWLLVIFALIMHHFWYFFGKDLPF